MFPWEVTQSVVKQPNDLVVSVASDECCQGKWIIAAGNRTFIFLWVHFHPAKVRKKNPTIKNDFIFSKGGEHANHTVSTCSQENGRTSMFMHFFLLCIRLTVLRSIYLTGHAYVCGQEGKEFGESRKGSYNPLQPNL